MKKILSLALAVMMLVSAVPMVYAADVDYTQGTAVTYTATGTEAYTVTVPAELAPGASGTVTLEGTWASNQTVKVTADASVTLTNSINADDTKTLDVTFLGIEKAGDNTEAKTYTETVSVAAMPADALFGTWSGKFNYNVEMVDVAAAQLISFTVDGTDRQEYQAEEGMTWDDFTQHKEYNHMVDNIGDFWTESDDGDTYYVKYAASSSFVIDENGNYMRSDSPIVANEVYTLTDVHPNAITFTVDGTEYQVNPGTVAIEWMNNNFSEEEAWEIDGLLYKIYESDGNGGGSLACLYNSATNTLVSSDYMIEDGANLYWQRNEE